MMELNNIPKSGTYAEGVDRHNDNYSKINLELKTIREIGKNEKGYFETLASLQAKYPSPLAGWQAYVADEGSSTGYYVANANSGSWTVTTAEAPPVGVDLAGYARTGGSEKTIKDVEGEITQLAGALNESIDIEWVANKYIDKGTGQVMDAPDYSVSKPVKAENDLLLTLSVYGSVAVAAAYYNKSGAYIGNLPIGDYVNYPLQLPANADTIILTTKTADIPDTSLAKRFDIENYATKIELDTTLGSAGIVNENKVITWNANKYVDKDTGQVMDAPDYSVSSPMKAEDGFVLNLSVYGSVAVAAAYYNRNGVYIGNLPIGDYIDYEMQFPSSADTFILTTKTADIPDTLLVHKFQAKNYTTKLELNAAIDQINGLEPGENTLQGMVNDNRILRLGSGVWNIDSPLDIPSNTRIIGVRGGTILKLRSGVSIANLDGTKSDITIENVTFEGKGAVTPLITTVEELKNRVGVGTDTGVYVNGHAKNIHVKNCEFRNFSKAGVHFHRTLTTSYSRTAKVTDCVFINNFYGLLSDVRSEYHTVVGCSFTYNQIGCFVAGGNNFFGTCHFDANSAGFVVSGTLGENDSHGSATGSSFNHNLSYSICAIDITNGFTFAGCHCFDGDILLSNAKGFNFTGGIISAGIGIVNTNSSYNIFHSNVFIKTYNGGTISGIKSKLSLYGNRFLDGDDSSSINNNI